MRYGFGVDIGGTTVKLAFFDETGALLDKWEIPTVTENGGKQILPDSLYLTGASAGRMCAEQWCKSIRRTVGAMETKLHTKTIDDILARLRGLIK